MYDETAMGGEWGDRGGGRGEVGWGRGVGEGWGDFEF